MTISPPVRPAGDTAVRTRRPVLLLVAAGIVFLGLCLWNWSPGSLQYDLRVYVVSAQAFLHGQDIYTAHLAYPKDMALGFTYPPFAALVFAPVALLGTSGGRVLMSLVNASALLVIGVVTLRALRPQWTRYRVAAIGMAVGAAGVALEPVRSTFDLGQVNLILAALLLVDLLGHLPYRFRGVLVGVVTGIKLTPGIFIVYLLVTRRYREAGTAAAATIGTMLAGAIAMPDASRQFWGHYIFDPSRPGATHFISNQAWRGVFARVNGGIDGIAPYWLLAVAITLALGFFVVRRAYEQGLVLESVLLTSLVGVLVSPISWTGHWVWALPIIAVLVHGALQARSWVLGGLALAWLVSTAVGLPWRTPYLGDKEYTHHGLQLIAGNSYALCAAATIGLALYGMRRRAA
ncbi:glycosyltransferase 87 family protein [Kribbella italica]|uniref:Alpha-1,2-mannosyltransferase n=1 Tax=Kribbella italica TaxID=1540520 RepID=A0A7W9MWJ4_9ACTN|nr:glycosyltransferase 87 family protein [Kribbella italica]MBB5838889.1 alpha-1,2-mannosyltransferase [Kribbella italica]